MSEILFSANCASDLEGDKIYFSRNESKQLEIVSYQRGMMAAVIVLSLEDEFKLLQLLNERAKERANRPLEADENIVSCKP